MKKPQPDSETSHVNGIKVWENYIAMMALPLNGQMVQRNDKFIVRLFPKKNK